MTTPRDPDRLIRAFLAEGPEALPDPAFDAVRVDIDRTRQRVVIGPWREPRMNNIAKAAIALAAVVVVAIVGLRLMPTEGGGTGGVAPTPSPTASPTASPTPSPSPSAAVVVSDTAPVGPLTAGAHRAVYGAERLPFSFTVPAGWTSGGWFITNDDTKTADGYQLRLAFWPVANAYTDPCLNILADPVVGPHVQDLALTMSLVPGTTDSSTRPVVVGGRDGTLVEYTIRPDNACQTNRYMLWRDPTDGDFWTWPPYGDRVRIWILDVDGTRFVISADIQPGTSEADAAELQQVVDSVTFGG